tara:strand:+ start:246 stop:410 length:165 start_codon:yes stop_codon:yes gene_type:complete
MDQPRSNAGELPKEVIQWQKDELIGRRVDLSKRVTQKVYIPEATRTNFTQIIKF